ncbi:MAG TPA: TatD family hydrolase [Candidatus Scybalocola faecigallinarum]|uniref:TatD family hydrolase n=1 Tax=Candidatus Scybalocola faecigallinarum TaxID=2840941 RepID=A0A9D1JQZ8_9FIRM|nr:TatD family hydrolase [Candidatus Scybalocola faecigallinarum]
MIFDTHAHYDDEQFDEDRERLLLSLAENNIGRVVNIGANIQSTKATVALTKKYPFIYGAVGVHPSDAGEMNEDVLAWLKSLTALEKIVAVGEIGLDYYWDKEEDVRENQKKWFIRQLEMARECDLPVSIHSRDAAKDTLDIMKEYGKDLGGVIHCFSYSVEMAREYVKMGYYIGVGGVVTFKNAKAIKAVVEDIPLERIVVETDCPYLAPVPNRGKRNSSLNLPWVIREISQIKGVSREEVEAVTWKNAMDLYRMKDGSREVIL